MKLYNLFKEIIIEEMESAKMLITEGVDSNEVRAAIDGMYNVNITYQDEGESVPSKRYIQVYVLGKTKAKPPMLGNDAIRAYQIQGGSKTVSNGWKIFRLDRIQSWTPTNMRWSSPVSDYDPTIPPFNHNGDGTFSVVTKIVDPSKFKHVKGSRSVGPKKDELPVKVNRPSQQPIAPKNQVTKPSPEPINNEPKI